jgi:hypothetical protein
MNISLYQKLNDDINQRFSGIISEFPLAFYYLETELRLSLSARKLAQKRNNNIFIRSHSIIKIYLTEIYIWLYFTLIFIFKSGHKKIFLNINRHNDLSYELEKYAISAGFQPIRSPKSFFALTKVLKCCPLGRIATNNLLLRKLHIKIAQIGLIDSLVDKNFMETLERVLLKQVNKVEKILVGSNIKGLVLQNEHCFHEKIIMQAAKKLKIDTVTVAHGYIQEPSLITIAPIRAKCTLVWTASQKNFIKKQDEKLSNKILYCGWPFKPIKKENSNVTSTLIILTDVDGNLNDDQFKRTLYFLKKYIHKNKLTKIRLHPSSIKSMSDRVKLLKNVYSDQISGGDLIKALQNANIIIGHDSTVLVTAVKNGIMALRFEETKKYYMPEIPTYSMQQILDSEHLNQKYENHSNIKTETNIKKIAKTLLSKLDL